MSTGARLSLTGGLASGAAVALMRPLLAGGGGLALAWLGIASVVAGGAAGRALAAIPALWRSTRRRRVHGVTHGEPGTPAGDADRGTPRGATVAAGVGTAAAAGAAFVVVCFARDVAVLGVLPGTAARDRLAVLWGDGFHDIAAYAAPAPVHAGLALVVCVAAVGVALLVDGLAAGLRRPALAGLPMLAVAVVPFAIAPSGVGVGGFLLAGGAYLLLLLADRRERLAAWVHPAGAQQPPAGRDGGAGPAWLAASALCLAVLAPSAAPVLHRHAFTGVGDGPGRGGDSVTVISPMASLRGRLTDTRDEPLLHWRTDAPTPDYLRLTTLDRFDGTQWTQSTLRQGGDHRVGRRLPVAPGLDAERVTTRRSRVRVAVGDGLAEHWLPVPYPVTGVDVAGDWKYDDDTRVVFSARSDTRRLSFAAESLQVTPTAAQLAAAATADATALSPAGTLDLPPLPAEVEQTARSVAGEGSALSQAIRMQDWFRDRFTYDLHVASGSGGDALQHFLATRRGYCEQFASAMAVFARAVGIPARVAIGFTPGTRTVGDERVVTTRDAHAWPELWFPGAGWLRFEPTPRADGQAVRPAYTAAAALSAAPAPGGGPRPPSAGELTARDERAKAPSTHAARPKAGREDTPTASDARTQRRVPWLTGVALLGLVAPALCRAALRLARRRRSRGEGPASAHAAWAELVSTALDLGWSVGGRSPRQVAALLAPVGVAHATAVASLARAEERARYARSAGGTGSGHTLAATLAEATRALRVQRPRWRRVLALLLPASVLRPLVGQAQEIVVGLARLAGQARHAVFDRPAVTGAQRR